MRTHDRITLVKLSPGTAGSLPAGYSFEERDHAVHLYGPDGERIGVYSQATSGKDLFAYCSAHKKDAQAHKPETGETMQQVK